MKHKDILIVGINSFIARALERRWRKDNNVIGIHHDDELPKGVLDLVVNFSCPSNPTTENGLSILLANSTLMLKVLNCAVASDAIFIQISSTAVKERRDEYGVGKMFSEMLTHRFSMEFQLNARIVRLRHTYGAGMQLNDGRAHTDIIGNAKEGRAVHYRGDGGSTRVFTHIDDVIDGIDRVATHGKKNGIYEVANPEGMTSIKKFAEIVARIAGVSTYSKGVTETTFSFTPDITSCLKIGWKPKISLEDGIRKTLAGNGIPCSNP